MLKRISILKWLLPAALLLSAPLQADQRPLVATLHPLLTELVARLAGDAVRVKCLMPPSADVHTFNPSPRDLAEIQDAALVVAMGKHLEHYLDRLTENLPAGVEIFDFQHGGLRKNKRSAFGGGKFAA